MLRSGQRSLGLSAISGSSAPQEKDHRSRDSQDTLIARSESEETLVNLDNMATSGAATEIERRRSFGIGGAGNIS